MSGTLPLKSDEQLNKSKALAAVSQLNVPGVSLESYMASVNAVPILSIEEEKALAERLYYHQDVEAARQLVLAHLRFVVHISKSYMGYGLPQADLIQEGNVGLMKAVKRFDPTVGVRLVSFAVHWIKAEIHEYVLKNWRIVKVATTKAQRKLFFNLRSSKKHLGRLTSNEASDIANSLGVSANDVKEMENRLLVYDAPFDAQPTTSGSSPSQDEEKSAVPANYLEDNGADPALQYEYLSLADAKTEQLKTALDSLDDRSRMILQRRWLTDKKSTLHELAAEYNVSAERVRQLEQSAFKKIKAFFLANTSIASHSIDSKVSHYANINEWAAT